MKKGIRKVVRFCLLLAAFGWLVGAGVTHIFVQPAIKAAEQRADQKLYKLFLIEEEGQHWRRGAVWHNLKLDNAQLQITSAGVDGVSFTYSTPKQWKYGSNRLTKIPSGAKESSATYGRVVISKNTTLVLKCARDGNFEYRIAHSRHHWES